jgi:hypothetical protein
MPLRQRSRRQQTRTTLNALWREPLPHGNFMLRVRDTRLKPDLALYEARAFPDWAQPERSEPLRQ